MIAVIDFDIGNLAAVANMFERLGHQCEITGDPERISRAERLILPGNGAFDACMRSLRGTGLVPLLEHKVLRERIPLLGICVGAQMLGHGSEEGQEPGLGWIDMVVRRFPSIPGLRVPHMGWRDTYRANPHYLTVGLEEDARFYFVHSYYLQPESNEDCILTASYGIDFAAGVARDNVSGVQFHPEKSHRFGKRLLKAFVDGAC